MTSSTGKQIITIHILPNVLKSKGDQSMKFGQLVEYNAINIFLQNLCGEWGRESSSRPLLIFLKSFI